MKFNNEEELILKRAMENNSILERIEKGDHIGLSEEGYAQVYEQWENQILENKPTSYDIWVVDDINEDGDLNISTLEDAGLYCSWISNENAILLD